MNKNVKAVALGVATTLVAPMTTLAYDQVENNASVLKSSNHARAIKSMDKAGVVTGVVAGDFLNVRSQSNSDSSIVGKYSNGETVIVTGQDSNGWYKVDFEGKVGYVNNKYVRITGDISFPRTTANLNMRWGPSTNNGIIKTIPQGTVVRLISSDSNGWSKIYTGGDVGFVSSQYLDKTSGQNSGGGSSSTVTESVQSLNKLGQVVNVVSNDTLNIRSQSNADSSKVGEIPANTKVHVTGKATNGWYRVNYNGVTGFVNNGYIKILGDYTQEEAPIGTRKTNTDLNLRSGPSTDYSVLLTIPRGGIVDYYSKTSDGWAKVKYNGKMGYVNAKYLTMPDTPIDPPPTNSNIESMTATGKVVKTNDFLNVRSQPNADSSILGKVYPNNTVTITGKDKNTGWYRINFNGSTGYVSNYYIELVNSNTTTKKITTANVNLRTGPSTSYSIIKTVASNTVVEVVSSSNGWAKVNVGGQTGYMSETYLKAYDGSSSGGGSLPSSKPAYSKVKIVVDPGHGGHDSGAVGNGLKEKDIILSVSKKVNSKLKSLGFQTIMTRSTDTYISLSERYNIANRNNADMFVSIHVNSGSSSASGIETLYKNYKTIANDIQNGLINETGAKSRGLKYRSDLAVLNGTRMPSALVEMGFISNSPEASKLSTSSYQDKIATGIVKGIAKYTDNNIRK